MVIVSGVLTLAFLADLAMLFGFIAIFAFKRSSPARHAAYAAAALGVLLTNSAFAALIGTDAELLPMIVVGVKTLIFAALAFTFALVVTTRRLVAPDHNVSD